MSEAHSGELKVLSLCCGAGGFDSGLAKSRLPGSGVHFTTAWAVDIWEGATTCVKHNFKEAAVFTCGMAEFLEGCKKKQSDGSGDEYKSYPSPGQPFLICAGLPCQGFRQTSQV